MWHQHRSRLNPPRLPKLWKSAGPCLIWVSLATGFDQSSTSTGDKNTKKGLKHSVSLLVKRGFYFLTHTSYWFTLNWDILVLKVYFTWHDFSCSLTGQCVRLFGISNILLTLIFPLSRWRRTVWNCKTVFNTSGLMRDPIRQNWWSNLNIFLCESIHNVWMVTSGAVV